MAKRGRHAWLPSIVIGEIEDIQTEEEISDFSQACHEMAKYARIGREVKRMMSFDFKNMIPFKNNKKKGKRNIFIHTGGIFGVFPKRNNYLKMI